MIEAQERNKRIIDEFRQNDGKVGGRFEGKTLLLLHTKGAKSGEERISPTAYVKDGDRYVIIASKGGAPTNPNWYHNLKANRTATIDVGGETVLIRATEVTGEERDRLYAKHAEHFPGFLEYQQKTTRKIPVF